MHDRMRHGLRRFGALALVMVLLMVSLTPGASAAAKPSGPLDTTVLDWNQHAIEALINSPTSGTPLGLGQPPGVASLHLAMVQGAVFDAVNMIDRGYQPYLDNLPQAPRSASKSAAVATAAHDVLVAIVSDPRVQAAVTPQPAPSAAIIARLDGLRDATLAASIAADGNPKVVKGIAAGEAAAEAMLAERANDGRYVPLNPPLQGGTEPGEWRPVASGIDPFMWASQVEPFTLTSPSQFRSAGPNAVTSDAYTQEYNEVKAFGSATGSARTPAQEALAQFYFTNPFEMFNRAFRTLAAERGLTIVEQARLFAMLDLAVADSLINCSNDKVYWGFWRPITAIHEGDNDGNPNTVGDPTWMPLLGTPPYSDHVSGYNCLTAGFMYAAKAFFGTDEMAFSVTKAGTTDTRHFVRFSDVCDDTIDVRVYHGLHFRTADVQGEVLGKNVAEWLAAHYFQPVKWNK